MNALTRSIKRAPKWTWYVVGGLTLGAFAIQLYKRKDARQAALNADGTSTDQVGVNPSPQPGIVVPPVILPQPGGDPLAGVLPLQDLYISAVGGVIGAWQDVANGWGDIYNPILNTIGGQNAQLIDLLGGQVTQSTAALAAIAQAGGPPVAQQSPIIAGNPAPASPSLPAIPVATGQVPQPAFTNCSHTECHCEGTGRARKCWTRTDHGHCYPDGHRVHISYDKVKDGC